MFKRVISLILIFLIISTNVFAAEDIVFEYEYMDRMFGVASELYINDEITKEEILSKAIEKYLKENPEAVNEIIKNGFSALDEYSEYYTEEEYRQFINGVNNTF